MKNLKASPFSKAKSRQDWQQFRKIRQAEQDYRAEHPPEPERHASRHDPYAVPAAPPRSASRIQDLPGLEATKEKYAAELERGRAISQKLGV